jgi:hypothetical protein
MLDLRAHRELARTTLYVVRAKLGEVLNELEGGERSAEQLSGLWSQLAFVDAEMDGLLDLLPALPPAS